MWQLVCRLATLYYTSECTSLPYRTASSLRPGMGMQGSTYPEPLSRFFLPILACSTRKSPTLPLPSPQCAQVTLLYSITTVCDDRAWLLGHTATIKQLADTAASKFAVYDAVMHTKLCVALAAANVCPAADWWVPCWSILQSQLHSGNSAVRGRGGMLLSRPTPN